MRPRIRSPGLRAAVAAALLTAGLVPLAVTLLFYLTVGEPRMQREILREHEQLAMEMGAVLNRNLFERYGDVRAFALNPVARDPSAWRTPEHGPLVEAMNDYVDIYDVYRLTVLATPSGEVLAVNSRNAQGELLDTAPLYRRDLSKTPWFADLLQVAARPDPRAVTISNPRAVAEIGRMYGDNGHVLPFATTVRGADGRVLGVWTTFFDFDKVGAIARDLIEQRRRISPAERRYQIFDRNGGLVFDSRPDAPNPRPAGVADLARRRPAGAPAISGVVDGEAVAIAPAPPVHGFPGMGWIIVSRESAQTAFREMSAYRRTVYGLLGLTAVGMLAFGAWVGRRLSQPILDLAARMHALAAGQLDPPIPHIRRSDDVGEMARALQVFQQALRDRDYAVSELEAGKAEVDLERQRLRDIVEGLGDGFFTVDRDWRITLVNSVTERHIGRPREEVLGQVLWEAYPGLDETELVKRVRATMREGGSANIELPSVLYAGRHIQTRLFPIPEGLGVWFRDVTAEKRSEAALRESEERRVLALEAAGLGAWDYDPNTGEIIWDARCRSLLGLPADEPVNYPGFLSWVHPDDREQVQADVREALLPGGPGRYFSEYRVFHGNRADQERWVASFGRVRFEDGRAIRMLGLVIDMTERKRSELQRELLVNELNHRVKNSLATVQAIAQQTLRADSDPAVARAHFTSRIVALARAHDVLTRHSWQAADLAELAADATAPWREADPDRVRLAGPPVRLSPKAALSLSMALFELATNAATHGALSSAGQVTIDWTVEDGRLRLTWRESGGPPVSAPVRRGFGSRLIEHGLAGELGAKVSLDYRPDGVVCVIDAPLAAVSPG